MDIGEIERIWEVEPIELPVPEPIPDEPAEEPVEQT